MRPRSRGSTSAKEVVIPSRSWIERGTAPIAPPPAVLEDAVRGSVGAGSIFSRAAARALSCAAGARTAARAGRAAARAVACRSGAGTVAREWAAGAAAGGDMGRDRDGAVPGEAATTGRSGRVCAGRVAVASGVAGKAVRMSATRWAFVVACETILSTVETEAATREDGWSGAGTGGTACVTGAACVTGVVATAVAVVAAVAAVAATVVRAAAGSIGTGAAMLPSAKAAGAPSHVAATSIGSAQIPSRQPIRMPLAVFPIVVAPKRSTTSRSQICLPPV